VLDVRRDGIAGVPVFGDPPSSGASPAGVEDE
jgi:hypothetical protein